MLGGLGRDWERDEQPSDSVQYWYNVALCRVAQEALSVPEKRSPCANEISLKMRGGFNVEHGQKKQSYCLPGNGTATAMP